MNTNTIMQMFDELRRKEVLALEDAEFVNVEPTEEEERLAEEVIDILEEEIGEELTEKLVTEKRIGFKKLSKNLQGKGKSKESADKIAAYIGRKKYGSKKMAKMAAAGRKAK